MLKRNPKSDRKRWYCHQREKPYHLEAEEDEQMVKSLAYHFVNERWSINKGWADGSKLITEEVSMGHLGPGGDGKGGQ